MNDSRYSASGTSQKSGIGDRSVVMCEVTPSIMLDGTAASAIHLSRRGISTSSMRPVGPEAAAGVGIVDLGAGLTAVASSLGTATTGGALVTSGDGTAALRFHTSATHR